MVKETKACSETFLTVRGFLTFRLFETFRLFQIFGHQSHAVPFNKSLAELIQTLLLLLQI